VPFDGGHRKIRDIGKWNHVRLFNFVGERAQTRSQDQSHFRLVFGSRGDKLRGVLIIRTRQERFCQFPPVPIENNVLHLCKQLRFLLLKLCFRQHTLLA
jgi:hypothetical protein